MGSDGFRPGSSSHGRFLRSGGSILLGTSSGRDSRHGDCGGEDFAHDSLDRLTQFRRNGVVTEILEYAPTGEPSFRELGT